MSKESRPEEKVISELIETALSSQLDGFKDIAVAVRTNLLKLIQGEADSVSVSGENIVRDDLQIKELDVQTDEVSIDPLQAVFGHVKLNEPVNTSIRVVLTEADLNANMNSGYVLDQLKPIELEIEGETIPIELQPPFRIRLPSDNKMRFTGTAKIHFPTGTRTMTFTSLMSPRTETQPILMESFCCSPNQGQTLTFMIAFLKKMQELTNQPYLEIEGLAVRVKSLEIKNKQLTTQIEIHADQIPDL